MTTASSSATTAYTARYPSLAGRTVFISGGATGIGEALVRAFHGQGAKVGVFTLPRDHKKLPPEPAKDALTVGDNVLLPVPAEILARFMNTTEKSRRSYAKP